MGEANVDKSRLDAIRRDWSEGKVPELPYLVIGQTKVKEHIGAKLSKLMSLVWKLP